MDWMYYPSVIFGLNWFSTIIFILLPLLSVTFVFFGKRRLLWIAPLISTILTVLLTVILEPSMFRVTEYRTMFFGIVIPIHIAISVVLTVIAYVVAYILKRRHQDR